MRQSASDPAVIVLISSARPKPVREAALVLAAMAIQHDVRREGELWQLMVHEEDQQAAEHQLDLYAKENATGKRGGIIPVVVDSGWVGVAGYLVVIWSLPLFATLFPGWDAFADGRLDAELVKTGELWRVVTALTLHADIAHIAANSLFGAVFGLFVGRYVGSGIGWLAVLLCAASANMINALIQPGTFRAIGASTASFAALGLVPVFTWRRGYFADRGWQRNFAPLFGAIAILVYTGLGGGNTDVLGHVFGFLCGLAGGYLLARMPLNTKSLADQQRAGASAVGLVVFAWLLAL